MRFEAQKKIQYAFFWGGLRKFSATAFCMVSQIFQGPIQHQPTILECHWCVLKHSSVAQWVIINRDVHQPSCTMAVNPSWIPINHHLKFPMHHSGTFQIKELSSRNKRPSSPNSNDHYMCFKQNGSKIWGYQASFL